MLRRLADELLNPKVNPISTYERVARFAALCKGAHFHINVATTRIRRELSAQRGRRLQL